MSRFVSALADIRSLFFYILFQLMLAGGNIIQMTNILLSDAGRSLNFTKNDAFSSDAIGKLYVTVFTFVISLYESDVMVAIHCL